MLTSLKTKHQVLQSGEVGNSEKCTTVGEQVVVGILGDGVQSQETEEAN